ncbi:MAG: sialate O-acetylesterase [Bacteroidota bacterium]
MKTQTGLSKALFYISILLFTIFAPESLPAQTPAKQAKMQHQEPESLSRPKLRVPTLVGNNMVLQRDMKLPLWGWAAKGDKVTLSFKAQTLSTKAGPDGKWTVYLAPEPAGGPFKITVSTKYDTIRIGNVMVGEVWLASGQSNMEMSLLWEVNNYQAEIAEANFPAIRFFDVSNKADYKPLSQPVATDSWKICTPANAGKFSATAYFFARSLHKKYNVPFGIIAADWSGTVAEAWVSAEALKAYHTEFNEELVNQAKSGRGMEYEQAKYKAAEAKWNAAVNARENAFRAKKVPFITDPAYNTSAMKTLKVPGLWEGQGLNSFDGIVWFRRSFTLTPEQAGSPIQTLYLGAIDDQDSVWLNGQFAGAMNDWAANRKYKLQQGILKEGENTIVVKVFDMGGGGGFSGKDEDVYLQTLGNKLSLSGTWQYEISLNLADLPARPQAPGLNQNSPSALFNGMISPIIPYGIRGAIWYQGESNAERAKQYTTLFQTLIKDWRNRWGEAEFPFLFCQLANFMTPPESPGKSTWAELREAQAKALTLPNTGMACLIDIGDAKDIHPKNKQDVGLRLALEAQKVAYKEPNVISDGPLFESMSMEGTKVRIRYKNIGKGLYLQDKYGYVKAFSIAGPDRKWYWAQGYLENNTVILYSDKVPSPAAVRFAWADNPDDINLFNEQGMPAEPFRTDDWME